MPVSLSKTYPTVLDAILTVESGDASPLEVLEAFGVVLRSGAIRGLQGSWQRSVFEALDSDLIDHDGNVTDLARDLFEEN